MLSTGEGSFPQISGTYPQFGGLGGGFLSKQLAQNVGCLPDISDSNPANNGESAQTRVLAYPQPDSVLWIQVLYYAVGATRPC